MQRRIGWWMVSEEIEAEGPAELPIALVAAATPIDALAHVADPLGEAKLAGLRVMPYSAIARLRTGRELRAVAAYAVPSRGTPWQAAVERDARAA